MTRLLLDQGIPYSTARLLNEQGWDVTHVSDLGMQRASDRQIIDYAREHSRICITLDADFHQILALQNANSPSALRIRQNGLKAPDVARLLRTIWPIIEPKLSRHAMITITETNIRIRYLPIDH